MDCLGEKRMYSTSRFSGRSVLGALGLFCAVIFTSCYGKSGQESAEILIGEYGSLTGSTATLGISTKNGIDMAQDKANKAGGILGKRIHVVVEDDRGKSEEAQTAITRLITKYGVVAILGEVASSRSLAAAPVAQQSHIPMISPASTNPKVTQVGDYIFRTCFSDAFQALVMAKFVSNNLKVKNVAIFRDIENDYSVGLADAFIEDFKKINGTIVADESYGEGDTDFSAQLTKIKSRNPQAIFVPGYYAEVGLIVRQARKLGLTMPLLGGGGWDSPKLLEIGGRALEGSYYFSHYAADDPNPTVQQFVVEYKMRYGEVPDAFAALGFDAAGVLFDAIGRADSTDPGRIRDALAQTKNYAGVTGTITLDANRNAVKPAVVLRISKGKIEYLETFNP
jgi:branched-chain amino acid transport system substrate-binding protein